MNIGQLETALGMTRANIRFYEKEGLLSPARSENGYRDYTGSDLDILRRIKLLRQLQFSLEDIRAMQTGALDLPPPSGSRKPVSSARPTTWMRPAPCAAPWRPTGSSTGI